MSEEDTVHAAATHLRAVPSPPGELETLFREHYDMVFRAAHRVTGSAADAEDVLQTVFLRLARRDREVDLSPSPGAYLRRAAVNAALDLIRSRVRSKSVAIDALDSEVLPSADPGPEAHSQDRELRDVLRRAVAGLGARAAEIAALRYLEGHENRDIAAMLGMSPVAVAVILHRSRARLKKAIGRYLETQS